MTNATTHYQTSFRVLGTGADTFAKVKANIYGWILEKEPDNVVSERKKDFFFRCQWKNMFQTRSIVETNTLLSESGDAWALHYMEVDKGCGRQRFWYTDIGLKQDGSDVVVSVRTSYARNTEDLSGERSEPEPTVPKVVRYLLEQNKAYCGLPQFRLKQDPLVLDTVGMGKVLAEFITSPERRYPLIVFNGNGTGHMDEAGRLARALAGKCQVVVVATNQDLGDELRHFLPEDYWVSFGYFRVFFPFHQRPNSPARHRWYNIESSDYEMQRDGLVHGLLRNHILQERHAVQTVDDVNRLVAREKLLNLKAANPAQQKELEEFFKIQGEVEEQLKRAEAEASSYANQVDDLEKQNGELNHKIRALQAQLEAASDDEGVNVSELLPSLPTNLLEVAKLAARAFPRLIITQNALRAASDFGGCRCVTEAWEILRHLQSYMWELKFKPDGQVDWERTFRETTGYDLAMSEGKQTQDDKKLMRLRKISHDGREYDITPHVKHGNQEPRLVRVYFAFDEIGKRIVVGHIGRHIPNYTTKKM
ncbi:MAG: hypothetical protein C5B50_27365 [Verrucomicrobia bacterium]|nr:MAG: hypothetical protein C5B50_27365 [Verrucomicrobiota bacterium]